MITPYLSLDSGLEQIFLFAKKVHILCRVIRPTDAEEMTLPLLGSQAARQFPSFPVFNLNRVVLSPANRNLDGIPD